MSGFRPAGLSDDDSEEEGWDIEGGGRGHNGDHQAEVREPAASTPKARGWREKAFGEGGTDWMDKAGMQEWTPQSDVDAFKDALMMNNVERVRQCLESGDVNVNQRMDGLTGGNPLLMACHNGHSQMVELLLEKGAGVEADSAGMTPLMVVCGSHAAGKASSLDKCAALLLASPRVDVNARQAQGMTALMFAARRGHASLISLLLRFGADANACDSQGWSALCFAADRGEGGAARELLESGADPDATTKEGMVAAELAGNVGHTELQEVIESFANRKSVVSGKKKNKEQGLAKFSELDNILLGMSLGEYVDHFDNHKVDLERFLSLSEKDLQEIGIEEVGVRKKIVDCISEIHKKDWERSSLPRITPRDKQKGIFLTSPDCVAMVANMAEHMRFLNANISYILKQVEEHPELLALGQDVADVSQLVQQVDKTKRNASVTGERLRMLRKTLVKISSQRPELLPADRIGAKTESRWKTFKLISVCIAVASVGVLCLVKARK